MYNLGFEGESISIGGQAYGAYSYNLDLSTGESSHEFGIGYPPGVGIFIVKAIELKSSEEEKEAAK